MQTTAEIIQELIKKSKEDVCAVEIWDYTEGGSPTVSSSSSRRFGSYSESNNSGRPCHANCHCKRWGGGGASSRTTSSDASSSEASSGDTLSSNVKETTTPYTATNRTTRNCHSNCHCKIGI